MTKTERWVRRFYHFNITQLLLNTILLFLLGTWYVGLPSEEDANSNLQQSDALPIASLPAGAFQSLDEPIPGSGGKNQADKFSSAQKTDATSAQTTKADNPDQGAILPGAADEKPAGEAGDIEMKEAGLAPPGSGGTGASPSTAGPINAYLERCAQLLRGAGSKKGMAVETYLPTADQWAAAVGTGDFFNPKTLTVLQRLKEGFMATGATMPPLPGSQGGGSAPFNPTY